MKDLTTYIDKNKFQFITSFEQVEITNTKGENIILDFGSLDIDERIFLSAFLTYVVQNEGISKKLPLVSLYDVVFNFNGNKKNKTSYHQTFIDVIGNFLRSNAHYIAYIIDNYKEIKENKTTIYRTQLNRSEMDLLYSLKFQRSYRTFVNVLYIMGVSKSNARTKKLNKIPLSRFYKDSVSMSKKRAAEIMEKLNIKYQIYEDNVYFSNGFGIDLDEKYYSDEKKQFEKDKFEEQILDSFDLNIEEEEQCKEIFEAVKAEEKVETEPEYLTYKDVKKPASIDLGDRHFNSSIFDAIIDKEHETCNYFENKLNTYFNGSQNERVKAFREFTKKIGDPIHQISENVKLKEVNAFYKNPERPFPNDEDWSTKKDIAKLNFLKLIKPVYKTLEETYDTDKDLYEIYLIFMVKNYKKLVQVIKYAEQN